MELKFQLQTAAPSMKKITYQESRVRMQVPLLSILAGTHLFMENNDFFDTTVTQLRRVNAKKYEKKRLFIIPCNQNVKI